MKIVLSTRNPSKAEQIKAIFDDSRIEVVTLDQAGISGEAVEDGATLEENALKKALFAHDQVSDQGTWAMADDTGIFIRALNGEPGVRSARWAGEQATTEEITAHTLKQLKSATDRSAIFKTVVALVSPESEKYFFRGEIGGHLLETPRVKAQPKMPYSPIFVPKGSNKVWAEMTVTEENTVSHRGQAFRQVKAFLEKLI